MIINFPKILVIVCALAAFYQCKKASTVSTSAPAVQSLSATSIIDVSAKLGGNITSAGTSTVTERGIYYGTSISNEIKMSDPSTGPYTTGNFYMSITGLTPNTKYYYHAYAKSSDGTSYGPDSTFTTSTELVTDVDGHVYHTIMICGKLWMKESLRTTRFRNSVHINDYSTGSGAAWSGDHFGGFSIPSFITGNDSIFGKLYNWYAVSNADSLAPKGWHIPTKSEIDALITCAGGTASGGGNLKSIKNWSGYNTGATNSTGFSANPAGYRDHDSYGAYANFGGEADFWAADGNGSGNYWSFSLIVGSAGVTTSVQNPHIGYSVRCVKN